MWMNKLSKLAAGLTEHPPGEHPALTGQDTLSLTAGMDVSEGRRISSPYQESNDDTFITQPTV